MATSRGNLTPGAQEADILNVDITTWTIYPLSFGVLGDTFYTQTQGSASPGVCTGVVTWISDTPGGAPVANGVYGDTFNVSNTDNINLHWTVSQDPANTEPFYANLALADYALQFRKEPYYLNVMNANAACLANVSNCNVTVPLESINQEPCIAGTTAFGNTSWQSMNTTATFLCDTYSGIIYNSTTTVNAEFLNWSDGNVMYYPFGGPATELTVDADTIYRYQFFYSDTDPSKAYSFRVSLLDKVGAEDPGTQFWIEQGSNNPITTTNGCPAIKPGSVEGSQLLLNLRGDATNHDAELDASFTNFFINIQTNDQTGNISSIAKRLEVAVYEQEANVNVPGTSTQEVTPVMLVSGKQTAIDFPESGEYLISATITDDKGIIYKQNQSVQVDLEGNTRISYVDSRDPHYDETKTITRGFLGYGPGYRCEPSNYKNDLRYKNVGESFSYNSVDYNMTQNMATCLTFNCLDECLGVNSVQAGPNGQLSKGTIDNCEESYYGSYEYSNEVLKWNTADFTSVYLNLNSDILSFPLVVPTESVSGTHSIQGQFEASGQDTLMWISTEPGGGPHNCFGYLDSYGNYYSFNGLLKFYATYNNAIMSDYAKSHAQLTMGQTYYINIARITGNTQNFLKGEQPEFRRITDMTVEYSQMSSLVRKDKLRVYNPAMGVAVGDTTPGSTFSNVSVVPEVEPMGSAYTERYGICAENWDDPKGSSVVIKVAPRGRIAMPFTTTKRMYKGQFAFLNFSDTFDNYSGISAYIIDTPEKLKGQAIGRVIPGSPTFDGYTSIIMNLEVGVDNYTTSSTSDVVLEPFTTYYLVLDNNTNQTFTANRHLQMEYSAEYGEAVTDYDLYPPWCINSTFEDVGNPAGVNLSSLGSLPSLLTGDIKCEFTRNQTVNVYSSGQRFTIKGQDLICTRALADCLRSKTTPSNIPTVQDVMQCAGIFYDSLNPDTPETNPLERGGPARDNDNVDNFGSPDAETYLGGGLNTFESNNPNATPAVLTGGASSVDDSVRLAINNKDFSAFNAYGMSNRNLVGPTGDPNWQEYLSQFEKFGNYSGYSNHPLTGNYDQLPSTFKIRKRKVKNPLVYGFEIPLKDGRYVNATSQRVTGGSVKTLAKPLKIVARTPKPLKTYNVRDEAFGKDVPSNLNETYRNTYYNPRGIASSFNTKGKKVQNITNNGFISSPVNSNVPGFLFGGGPFDPTAPGTAPRLQQATSNSVNESQETVLLPDQLQPIAQDLIYSPVPDMTIQPLKIDEKGSYVPAGPAARLDLRQPTPEASFTALQAASVEDGTELFINERKIVFRNGSPLEDIKTQINCGKFGVRAIIRNDENNIKYPGSSTSIKRLVISSCDNSPWSVANGCGGGIFQQVGDFHVNRGFENTKSITSTFVPAGSLGGSGNVSVKIPYTDPLFPGTGRLVDVTFDKNAWNNPTYREEYLKKDADDNEPGVDSLNDLPNGAMFLPTETITLGGAGQGYRVGDRLRLVGGTPVNSNKGPLTRLCIDVAGAGYVDPQRIDIIIGDGSTPGVGAAAFVSELDMNGGIAEITMTNYGIGYDPGRPPKIQIIDKHSDKAYRTQKTVNALNQFDPVILRSSDVFRYDQPSIVAQTADETVNESYIDIVTDYYRISNTQSIELQAGGVNRENSCQIFYGGNTVDGNYPTIDIATGTIYGELQHTEYKAVIGMPQTSTVLNGQYIRLVSTGTGANASVVSSLPDLLVSDHMIGKNASNNDTIALNMPIVRNRAFLNASTINKVASEMAAGNVTVEYAKLFQPIGPTFVPVAPYGIPKTEATVSGIVGVIPERLDGDPDGDLNPDDPFYTAVPGDPGVGGYRSLGGPQRVAKFLVSEVDVDGGIVSLKLLDRGLYRIFPSDLTFGIPLEYDVELLGVKGPIQAAAQLADNPIDGAAGVYDNVNKGDGNALGGVDPLRNNIVYGYYHPEYWDGSEPRAPFGLSTNGDTSSGASQGAKHPDWVNVGEYKIISDSNGAPVTAAYWGSPGAYDPTTYVILEDGSAQPKTKEFVIDPQTGIPTSVRIPERSSGGQGARVFLTAQDVPDCSEEGDAQEKLGLPDNVTDLDGPRSFVRAANTGLEDVGYLPPDITWNVDGEGPIPTLTLDSVYPGVRFNGLDWFGIPSGDYAAGALCIQATLSSPNLTTSQIQTELEKIYQESEQFGLTQETFTLPNPDDIRPINTKESKFDAAVLSLLCIDSIETDPNSVFGDGPVFKTINELYKYDITNIFGQEVKLNGVKQDVDAFIFESRRFAQADTLNFAEYYKDISLKSNAYVSSDSKLWVDSVTIEDTKANIELALPGFINGGWAYVENGQPRLWQTPMVDTRYIHNSIIYDPKSGARTTDLYPWDPFKGVFPGFIDKEIDYISENDPVVYNAQRHQFGPKQVGSVWWDTSSIRYQWYEQGANVDRWKNWGRAFPGSTIIICEWVESRAKPQNWNGDGTPRWLDQFITERRWDPVKQEYQNFYYYWVMNRTTVDARLRETRNRKYDTRTIARYLSDPVGFGIHMISFLSSNAVMFSNLSDVLRDSGNHVQINLARDLDPDGIKHTAWKLIREDDDNSVIPENITLKLTDSLAGENLVGEAVPDPGLSSVMSYGAKFRPRQGMFVNIQEARRTMAYVMNEIFANLKLYTDFPTWNIDLPAEDTWQYIERVTYYSVIYVDENTNEPVRYDDSYKPVFNVETVSDLDALVNLPDGTVVQVEGDTQLAEPQLWIYNLENNQFDQIAIVNDTIRFKDNVFTDETNSQMSLEIRNILNLFSNDLFQRFNFWNILFFEMLKYAYMEQKQLDWAFKTSYLYVEKEEVDLIQISGFKPDNYEAILNYMDEAKPYSSKVREYRDGKSPPMEIIGTIKPGDIIPGDGDYNDIGSGVPGIPGLPGPGPDGNNDGGPGGTNPNAGLRSVSDFDKPPYPDPNTGTIRILDDFNQSDREIMATDPNYVNYFSVPNKADDPIRHITTNLTYDRTNWRFTEYLWNANTVPLENSITNNIVNLTTQTVREVASNANVRAIDRIFKFDPGVINQFNLDIENNYTVFKADATYTANSYVRRANQTLSATFDLYKSNKYVSAGTGWKATDWDLQETPYTEIETNVDIMYDIVESGNLNFTLALLKNKVGGGWQGETLDANVFTKVVPGSDPTYDYQTIFGYGTEDYEQFYWDVVQEVNNYVGIFKPPPEVNLRRNDRDYDGFDGISFLRVLYGEERPEELVQVDPYETFIVNCVTNTETAVIPIGIEDIHFVDGANTVIGNDKDDIDPPTGSEVIGLNGNIEFSGGTIANVNLSKDLINRSYGTCRAVSIEAVDASGSGANASFQLNLQSPPDGWPAGASWPQIASIDVLNGGTGYDPLSTTIYLTVALNKNANPVQFQIFESLFGQTDYSRVRDRALLAEDLYTWSEEIVVTDPSLVPDPLPGKPGYMWIDGSELVKYERKNKTTGVITQFQRGAEGTTIQDWYASGNVEVWDGSDANKFNDIDPWRNIWLDQGFRYEQIYNWDDDNYGGTESNVYPMLSEVANANVISQFDLQVVSEGNVVNGWQPGWDYGNLVEQTCNVSSITYIEEGKARLTVDCEVPQGASFVKITTDFAEGAIQLVIDETLQGNIIVLEEPLTNVSIIGQQVQGNGNVISNVQLIPAGNEDYDPLAMVRSNVYVLGTATGNISITELYNPVIDSNINVTAIASINGQNVHAVANTINNLGLPTVEAIVDQVWTKVDPQTPTILRDYLKISGRSFVINEIDTPTLHIEPGRYEAEYFEAVGAGSNTIIVEDDIWVNEAIIAGMSNTLVTYTIDLNNIPWDYANATGFPALSLADLANTDSTDTNSIMKFLHGVETESDT